MYKTTFEGILISTVVIGTFFFSTFLGCNLYPDEDQVQVVTDVNEFESFPFPPRDIIYGPYSLKVTTDSAIIAWEEKDGTSVLRHVEVPITDLSQATEYFYRVNGASQDGRFLTATEDDAPFSFLVWSDSRTGTDVAMQIADQMISLAPDASFVLHAGDLVIDGDREECWKDEWWFPMHDLLLHCPIYPAMGNHEEDSEFYYRYFSSLGGKGTNYSFDWGTTHLVVCKIDDGSSEQIEWLEKDLESSTAAELTIVCHHVPMYSSTTSNEGGIAYLQDSIVPLFEKYGVDLVISGDVHSYQHHFKNNIHYLISAGGGEKPYDYGLPLEGMTLTLLKTYNFSCCRVENNTMYITTYNQVGELIDSFEIVPDSPSIIKSQIEVEASSSEVTFGEQFRVDFYISSVEDLNAATLTLDYYKDEPPVVLEVIDADPLVEGIQVEPGELGGEIQANSADNHSAILGYHEENIGGLNSDKVKIASAVFRVPEEAYITAMYLVPKVTLFDTSGSKIFNFMGGTRIIIKKR